MNHHPLDFTATLAPDGHLVLVWVEACAADEDGGRVCTHLRRLELDEGQVSHLREMLKGREAA